MTPLNILLGLLGLTLFVLGLRALVWAAIRQQAKQMVAEFQELFPGRCMICSYHRYGVENGFTVKPLEPHNCIEAKTEADEKGIPHGL